MYYWFYEDILGTFLYRKNLNKYQTKNISMNKIEWSFCGSVFGVSCNENAKKEMKYTYIYIISYIHIIIYVTKEVSLVYLV